MGGRSVGRVWANSVPDAASRVRHESGVPEGATDGLGGIDRATATTARAFRTRRRVRACVTRRDDVSGIHGMSWMLATASPTAGVRASSAASARTTTGILYTTNGGGVVSRSRRIARKSFQSPPPPPRARLRARRATPRGLCTSTRRVAIVLYRTVCNSIQRRRRATTYKDDNGGEDALRARTDRMSVRTRLILSRALNRAPS